MKICGLPIKSTVLTLIISILIGCGGEYARPAESTNPGSIVYGTVTNSKTGELQNLTLEIATPDPVISGPGPYPAILYIHGGTWYAGNWDDFENEMNEAAGQGYVAISINYRLLTRDPISPFFPVSPLASQQLNEWPAAMQDANCAARWINAHAEDYNIQTVENADKKQEAVIGTIGYSAGATSSLLLAFAKNNPDFQSTCVFDGLDDTAEFSSHISSVAVMDM